MKRLGIVALVLSAVAAGFAGSLLQNHFEDDAQPVQAQQRQANGIRVALVNLEEVSRQSKEFQKLKGDWESAQKEIAAQNKKWKDSYEAKKTEIQKARVTNEGDETVLMLRVELQAIEEAMKAAEQEQKEYLSKLLEQYQKDVLIIVMKEVEEYATLEKYDIVLQDYTVKTSEADFFSGSAYAQALMTKPVLYCPGVLDKKNGYVTDITDAIINRLK